MSTGYLLKRLGYGFKEKAMDAFEPTGLNPQHHAVLSLLEEGSCRQQGTLADGSATTGASWSASSTTSRSAA